ncbi:MAG: alcohol dehydrogenase catalytic domain-containing protein [Firmicutes bacterium]|nr:alcohol dehydrogenase catalytic domain-containing protein [Bacillota bacterium]
MDRMLGAVFEGEGRLSLKEVPIPRRKDPDDVLLGVKAASICGTDVHILSVPPGHPATPNSILGHEYVAEVLETGPAAENLHIGDQVVIDPNITCGRCRYCQAGMPNMCENMTTLGIFRDGGFAAYNVAPVKALHKIDRSVPYEIAAFAEPLSCVVNGTEKVKAQPGEAVVVLGAGPIGLLFTQFFHAAGVRKLIVAEVSPFRAGYAQRSGATRVVNPRQESLKDVVLAETGIGADIVVDAVGSLLPDALSAVRRGGRVLLFGMNQHATPAVRQFDITRHEVSVLGTYIARHTFPKAVRILESGVLGLETLITHRLPLARIEEGFKAMREGTAIKVMVMP